MHGEVVEIVKVDVDLNQALFWRYERTLIDVTRIFSEFGDGRYAFRLKREEVPLFDEVGDSEPVGLPPLFDVMSGNGKRPYAAFWMQPGSTLEGAVRAYMPTVISEQAREQRVRMDEVEIARYVDLIVQEISGEYPVARTMSGSNSF